MNSFLLLFTCAAFAAAQQIPRPEYPQPQFERADWLNRNGAWEFEFEDCGFPINENCGRQPAVACDRIVCERATLAQTGRAADS